MHKCDSCGKVVVNEQDYMCPHCGAVSNKHCDHNTHLPDDKYNRANDYRTTAAEHKSKTYDYQKAPKTDASQKFDINDLANIKNVEDAKQVAKKAFIEQDQNGRKKFKPLAIVLIVIFAVNIFGNILDVADSAIDIAFDEIEEVVSMDSIDDYRDGYVEDLYGVSELENSIYTDYDTVYSYVASANVQSAYLDTWNDILEIQLSGIGFNKLSINIEKDGISYKKLTESSFVVLCEVSFITSDSIDEFEASVEETDTILSYAEHAKFKGYLSGDGVLSLEGIASKLDEYDEDVYFEIRRVTVLTEIGVDCYNGDYDITPNIIRCDSFGDCNFYEYQDVADETLAREHFEMVVLTEYEGYDLQDESSYDEIIEF